MTCNHEYHWFSACNEDGWKCVLCGDRPGEPSGFAPQLDRELVHHKVFAILDDLVIAKIVYVSNATSGDCIVRDVACRCRRDNRFDQYSIALFILQAMTPSHAEYWDGVSTGVLTGNDPRDRCKCGKLSNCTSWKDGVTVYSCSEHRPPLWGDEESRP